MHEACRYQAIPLAVVKEHSRQKHVVLEAIDTRDLAPHKQPKIDRDDGIAHNKQIVVLLVTVALYWLTNWRLACKRSRWWWRWRCRVLRRRLWRWKIHGISAAPFRHRHDWLGTTRLFDASHLQNQCCCASQVRVRRDWHQLVVEADRLDELGPTPVIP